MENLMNVVIESFEKLEMEDKEYVFDLLKKHIIKMRRDKIEEYTFLLNDYYKTEKESKQLMGCVYELLYLS